MTGRILVATMVGILFVALSTAGAAHNSNRHRSGARAEPGFSQSGESLAQFGHGSGHRRGHRQDRPTGFDNIFNRLQGAQF
jgi:hypothetical protein